MSDPSWLFDDESPVKSPPAPQANGKDVTARLSSPNGGIPRPPPTGKPSSTPSRKQVQRNNTRLEEEGLEFLQSPVVESFPQVVKETRSGVLIMDEDLAPIHDAAGAPGSSGGKTAMGAPVHFLKRMREAEEKRLQRLEKIANGEKPSTATGGARKLNGIGARPSSSGGAGGSSVYKRLGSASLRRSDSNVSSDLSNNANKSSTNAPLSGPSAIGTDGGIIETETVDLSVVPPLTEDDRADYSLSVKEFGEDAVRKLRSNRYQHRVEALREMKEKLIIKKHLQDDEDLMKREEDEEGGGGQSPITSKKVSTPASSDADKKDPSGSSSSDDEDEFGVKKVRSPEETAAHEKRKEQRRRKQKEEAIAAELVGKSGGFKMTISSANADTAALVAMVEVLSVALKDSLFHVVVAGCDLLDGVLENYTFFDKSFVDDHLRGTITTLITRLKDSNGRTKDAAVATLLNLSAHVNVGPPVVVSLVAKSVPMPAGADSTEAIPPSSARDDWRYTVAKIDLCHSILDAKPRYMSNVSDDCLRIATHGLQSANPQARKRAAAFFGLVRTECGLEGIRRYLSTISPATIKMLKQEIGIDDGNLTLNASTGSALNGTMSAGMTATAAKLAAHLSLENEVAAKEEAEDMASFEGDGDAESITEDQQVLIDFIREQFPEIKSFALLFSSRWNLRERVILRLYTLLEDKALAMNEMGNTTGGGGGILAKLTAANIQHANNTLNSSNGGAMSVQQKLSPPPSSSSARKPPIAASAKRFMQKDDSDEDDDEKDSPREKRASHVSGVSTASALSASLTKRPGTGSGVRERLEASRQLALQEKAAAEAEEAVASKPASIVTSEQLGAIAGICEKSFTDSVPAVAAAAIKLLRIVLSGYHTGHSTPTPPPSTPIDGSARGGKPPRTASASIRSGGSSNNLNLNNNGNAGISQSSPSDDVPAALLLLVPRLVMLTTGNLTSESALDALVLIAELPFITLNGAILQILVMEKIELIPKASVKSICARLDSCSHLLASCGGDKNIDLYKLMSFATVSFQHREPKARTSAANLVCEVYKRVGDRIQPHLELIKGAVGDDLRAKMSKITLREKQLGGGTGRVRLAVFGSTGSVLSLGSPTPSPPIQPGPLRNNFHKSGIRSTGNLNLGEAAADSSSTEPPSPAVEMAQGKNRKGNLVFS